MGAIPEEVGLYTHLSDMPVKFGEAFRIRVKKFKQNFSENYSKGAKIAITSCKFSKSFQGSMPPYRSRTFLVSQSASN